MLAKYSQVFVTMEDSGILDKDNDVMMAMLHYVFKERIQADLEQWRVAHNHAGIRTENNKTPMQLVIEGTYANRDSGSMAIRNLMNTPDEIKSKIKPSS